MTETEFYSELDEINKENPFELTGGQIRQKETHFCPILAVAKKHDFPGHNLDYNSAGQALNLPEGFTHMVVTAADYATHCPGYIYVIFGVIKFSECRDRLCALAVQGET